jgi:hypothetical protein
MLAKIMPVPSPCRPSKSVSSVIPTPPRRFHSRSETAPRPR